MLFDVERRLLLALTEYLSSLLEDCRICVWNAVDGSLVHSLTGHTESVRPNSFFFFLVENLHNLSSIFLYPHPFCILCGANFSPLETCLVFVGLKVEICSYFSYWAKL